MTPLDSWPDNGAPGVPLNPHEAGFHYVGDGIAFWRGANWLLTGRSRPVHPANLAKEWWAIYRGPCPDHPDVATKLEKHRDY